jgi:hypothetical protein
MSENLHAGQGSVLLDIGGDVGALVVSMPASTVGIEIEIAPTGHPHEHTHHRPHVAVVDRPVPGGTLPSLVFPELVEGSYDLFEKGDDFVRMCAEVIGGQVTFADWVG